MHSRRTITLMLSSLFVCNLYASSPPKEDNANLPTSKARITSENELIAHLKQQKDKVVQGTGTSIKELNLCGVFVLTDSFIELLPTLCPELVKLDVRGCTRISRGALELYSQSNPVIQIITSDYWSLNKSSDPE